MPPERASALTATASPAVKFFAVSGALCLAASALLAFLGSFAFIAAAAVGLFFVAAALISYSTGETLGLSSADARLVSDWASSETQLFTSG